MWLHTSVYGHRKRVCTESWLLEKKIPCCIKEPNRTCVSGVSVGPMLKPTELPPHPTIPYLPTCCCCFVISCLGIWPWFFSKVWCRMRQMFWHGVLWDRSGCQAGRISSRRPEPAQGGGGKNQTVLVACSCFSFVFCSKGPSEVMVAAWPISPVRVTKWKEVCNRWRFKTVWTIPSAINYVLAMKAGPS